MSGSANARIFLGAVALFGLTAVVSSAGWRPLNVHTGYAPEQPVKYSHRLHAGELGIDCLYCHYGARTSRHAGIPPTGLCMNCHKVVSAAFDTVLEERERAAAEEREPARIISPEIAKVYAAMGLDEDLQPLPGGSRPIAWTRVHNLPDFVAFDHSVHVARGVACTTCHGQVQSMERVRQESDLSMGWCIACHRSQPVDPARPSAPAGGRLPAGEHVSTDCAGCHH